jgi:20S proteasome subunit beta 7
MADAKPITHLTSPIVTGSTVIGIKFDKGVILACDTMLSYGGLLSNYSLI